MPYTGAQNVSPTTWEAVEMKIVSTPVRPNPDTESIEDRFEFYANNPHMACEDDGNA